MGTSRMRLGDLCQDSHAKQKTNLFPFLQTKPD
jgi:hypothetical protein